MKTLAQKRKMTKRQIRKAWLDALESGKYRQGKGALSIKKNGKHKEYCCLGVLCELAAKEGVVKKHTGESVGSYTDYEGKTYYLPIEVMEWAGIRTKQGYFNGTTLADLNDKGSTFKEIAKTIRKHKDQIFRESK